MKRFLSLALTLIIFALSFISISGCNKNSASDINGMYMVSSGVVLSSNAEFPLTVKVYDRYGDVIFSTLKSVTLEDFPQLQPYKPSGDLYFLDFGKIAEVSQEGSYKCRYTVEGSKTYLEHTYIVSPSDPEEIETFSVKAYTDGEKAFLSLKTDPTYSRLLKIWTDAVPEDRRFADTALECISTYDQIAAGEMIYSTPAVQGGAITFETRAIYSAYSYMPDEVIKVDNPDYPKFVSEIVCLDLLNTNDTRVAYLGNDTHMKKFTIYNPGESITLDSVYISSPPAPVIPPKLTAELKAVGNKAKLTVSTYPNVAYYRAVITENCNGVETVVFNDTISPARLYAQADIRTDKSATYSATVYAKLTDGSSTNKIAVSGFTTSFVSVPTPEIKYENGEVTAVFPRKANVTVWKSGSSVSADSLVIGNNGVYSYVPDGSGEYGFIFKVTGNGAEILDSALIETKKVTVK